MFKNWSLWLGTERENGQVQKESESVVDVDEDKTHDTYERKAALKSERNGAGEENAQPVQEARGFSGKFSTGW